MKSKMLEEGDSVNSPTWGKVRWNDALGKIVSFIGSDKTGSYELIIGSDSLAQKDGADFVSALIVHKRGGGAIYFWQRHRQEKIFSLKQRIWQEATMSLEIASKVAADFNALGLFDLDMEIHVDIGEKGPTREMINEVTAMIRASGFKVATKPSSWGASHVADRHV